MTERTADGLIESAVTKAMAWHPSESGPSYDETRKEVEALISRAMKISADGVREDGK